VVQKLGEDKVGDHYHFTGKFRGAAHNECNLQYRVPKFIPVFFHNLSRYDAHLFIKKLPDINNFEGKIKCIAKSEENYISFSKVVFVDEYFNGKGEVKPVKLELRFIDRFRFMPTSLDALIRNLDTENCKNIKKCYPEESQFILLKRKGVRTTM